MIRTDGSAVFHRFLDLPYPSIERGEGVEEAGAAHPIGWCSRARLEEGHAVTGRIGEAAGDHAPGRSRADDDPVGHRGGRSGPRRLGGKAGESFHRRVDRAAANAL